MKRENDRLAKKRKCQAKTEEQTANCCAKIEEHKDDMANLINWSMKEAMNILHRTKILQILTNIGLYCVSYAIVA